MVLTTLALLVTETDRKAAFVLSSANQTSLNQMNIYLKNQHLKMQNLHFNSRKVHFKAE